MAVKLSALRADRLLTPGRFLVLISARGCVDFRVILRMERLGQLKNFNYLIGNRTRDLLVCSVVPQPTTLPLIPKQWSPALTLGSWVLMPLDAWMSVRVSSESGLSCVGKGIGCADHPSKEFYQVSVRFMISELINSEREQIREPNQSK
jgi:hypothetical protein